jgi:hypothetical protein
MNWKEIFSKVTTEQKEVLFCENDSNKFWLCKDLDATWIRVENHNGIQVESIYGDKKTSDKLDSLYNNNNCVGGIKKETIKALKKINGK